MKSFVLRPVHALALALAFFRDLVISSIQVAKTVLSPRDIAQPRFVTVPLLEASTGLEITMIANYITLTPGTLTVDLSPDGRTLLVHSLLAGGSSAEVRADIQQGIEKRVMRVTRA